MLRQENDKFVRVTKGVARRLFEKGGNVFMMGNKTRLNNNMWVQPMDMSSDETFDWNVNNFYYYLDSELGSDVAFYIEKKVN